jgi:hypothetical protein
MLGPSAIITASAAREHFCALRRKKPLDQAVLCIHWALVLGGTALFLIGAATGTPRWMTRRADGAPWYAPSLAYSLLAIAIVMIAVGATLHFRARASGLMIITLLLGLVGQAVVMRGYGVSRIGLAEMRPLAELVLARFPDARAFNAHPLGKRPPTDLGVYLNRTIRWTKDPSSLKPSARPLVLFVPQNAADPSPAAPPGWLSLGKAHKSKDWWHAFALPAVGE